MSKEIKKKVKKQRTPYRSQHKSLGHIGKEGTKHGFKERIIIQEPPSRAPDPVGYMNVWTMNGSTEPELTQQLMTSTNYRSAPEQLDARIHRHQSSQQSKTSASPNMAGSSGIFSSSPSHQDWEEDDEVGNMQPHLYSTQDPAIEQAGWFLGHNKSQITHHGEGAVDPNFHSPRYQFQWNEGSAPMSWEGVKMGYSQPPSFQLPNHVNGCSSTDADEISHASAPSTPYISESNRSVVYHGDAISGGHPITDYGNLSTLQHNFHTPFLSFQHSSVDTFVPPQPQTQRYKPPQQYSYSPDQFLWGS